MIRIFLGLLALIATAAPGCARSGLPGSGVAKTETREIGSFDAVEFVGDGRVEITIGEPQPLEISGDDNLLPLIRTEVRDSRLVIKPVQKIRPRADLVVKITTAELKALTFEGTGLANVVGVNNDRFEMVVTGAGFVSASGQTDQCEIMVTGSGSIRIDDLRARRVKVKVTGSGNADVQASESLDVSIVGAGAVRYTGDPRISQTIVGVGSVTKKN